MLVLDRASAGATIGIGVRHRLRPAHAPNTRNRASTAAIVESSAGILQFLNQVELLSRANPGCARRIAAAAWRGSYPEALTVVIDLTRLVRTYADLKVCESPFADVAALRGHTCARADYR